MYGAGFVLNRFCLSGSVYISFCAKEADMMVTRHGSFMPESHFILLILQSLG
jgi:hypothetical protein